MINSEMEHSWRQEGNILLRDDERIDDLQRNHYGIIQRKGTFCFGMDAVLLSGFAVVKPGEKALDLGTGTGIIPILLEAKTEGRHFTGLEIQEESADMARRSVKYNHLEEKVEHMRQMKSHFVEEVLKMPDTVVHGLYDETSAPHIISVGFAGVRSEVLLHALEDKGICVSAGSACASNHPAISGVLKGIGAKKEYLDATIRFSMSEMTTEEEMDYTLQALQELVPMLRRYTRH